MMTENNRHILMKGKVQIMTGKQTCDTLKKIRRDIVEYNNFDIQISDCPHGNDVKCPGTCPNAKPKQRLWNAR